MSAGLAASTVTPGSTAADASRRVPVTDACANRGTGSSRRATNARHVVAVRMGRVSFYGLSMDLATCTGSCDVHIIARKRIRSMVCRREADGAPRSLSLIPGRSAFGFRAPPFDEVLGPVEGGVLRRSEE